MAQVIDIVKLSPSDGSSISDSVVFPEPEFLAGPPALRHIRSAALLRLVDRTIWLLVLDREVWTIERLRAAAEALKGVSGQAFTTGSVERLLRQELGVHSLSVTVPVFDRIDEHTWEFEKVAFARVRQSGAHRVYPQISRIQPAASELLVRRSLRAALGKALRDFADCMDPQALQLATPGGRFDLRVYNYLAYGEYTRYRLQFAETFPSLLQTAVVAGPGSFGEDIRSIVDTGAPLIKGLAARWKVRRGVIRHLVGRGLSYVGLQWSRDAKGLALSLNALHPQDVPDNPAEWDEFNRMVMTGLRLFVQPVWRSAAGLKWLRMCVRLSRRGDREALSLWLPQWNHIDQIVQFRAALANSLRRECANVEVRSAADAHSTFADAIDNAVLDVANQGLSEVAALFEKELRRIQKEDRNQLIRSRQMLMPLIPSDFVSADGSTCVSALCTNEQLAQHGTAVRNCLRSTSAASLAAGHRPGMVFVIGMYDVASGRALSTAEIRAVRVPQDPGYRLVVVQHTARANRKPDRRCNGTLRQLLDFCQTEPVREHLIGYWHALRCGSGNAGGSATSPTAVRVALGEQTHKKLVTRFLHTAQAESANGSSSSSAETG